MKNLLATLFSLLSFALTASGQLTYGSVQIENACKKMNLHSLIPDSISDADTILAKENHLLALRINNHKIEHVGCQLFAKEQRQAFPSPVYDYLEFAGMDMLYGLTENPFVYQNLIIEGGDWNKILANAKSSATTINNVDNKLYQVTWTQGDGQVISITFPIGYEKLYRMSRTELENQFIKELSTVKAEQQKDIAEPDSALLQARDNGVLVLEGQHYLITEVNQNLYYMRTEQEGLILVWDKQKAAESVANMFVSHDKWLTGYPIKLRIPTHERTTTEVQVTVRQLLAYAHKTGCKVYWGLESLRENELKGTLFLYNADYGFDHVFNITCDPRLIGTKDLEFSALVALFSPTTNIKNLFATSKGKSTPKKIE